MLVLSRRVGERIWIGDNISITVVRLTNGGVRLGIEAPAELPVVREELKIRMETEKQNQRQVVGELATQVVDEQPADEA